MGVVNMERVAGDPQNNCKLLPQKAVIEQVQQEYASASSEPADRCP